MKLTEKDIELIEKYGPLTICSIEESYWAVNGKYLCKIKNEKIERLSNTIKKLQYDVQVKNEEIEQLKNRIKANEN